MIQSQTPDGELVVGSDSVSSTDTTALAQALLDDAARAARRWTGNSRHDKVPARRGGTYKLRAKRAIHVFGRRYMNVDQGSQAAFPNENDMLIGGGPFHGLRQIEPAERDRMTAG
jgi:hypothetical protein